MGQITTTRNLVATKVVRLAGQWWIWASAKSSWDVKTWMSNYVSHETMDAISWSEPQIHFLGRKLLHFDLNSTQVCSYESNGKTFDIGFGNSLAPNRWQTINWINDELIQWHIYITVTSWWARWSRKSPAPRLLTQPFVSTWWRHHVCITSRCWCCFCVFV